ncbi:hypothetical protein HDR58_02190 [bacterium]|nr:hypothetical protein [bacterium]
MKTKLLLIAAIALAVQLQSNAAISVDQTTNPAYLKNYGYSQQTADAVSVSRARAIGEEYYPEDELAYKKQNKFLKFWRKLYVYADPAAEDYSYYHHDTKTTPGIEDL